MSGKAKKMSSTAVNMKPEITDKEMKSLQYLSGFVLHKMYKKIASGKNLNNNYNLQCCSILHACKVETDESQTLINVRDRGGLWRANPKIIDLFVQCEMFFESKHQFLSPHSPSKIL